MSETFEGRKTPEIRREVPHMADDFIPLAQPLAMMIYDEVQRSLMQLIRTRSLVGEIQLILDFITSKFSLEAIYHP